MKWYTTYLEYYSIENLRPEQELLLHHVKLKSDAMVILPTGYGKSIAYQLAPLCTDPPSKVIVVLPLVSLIRQQFTKIEKVGKPVYVIDHATATKGLGDDVTHLLLTPEALQNVLIPLLQGLDKDQALQTSAITHIFIDESHCIANWGYEGKKTEAFRKTYGQIGDLRSYLPAAAVIALTATATLTITELVVNSLQLAPDHITIRLSPEKPNIRYSIVRLVDSEITTTFSWLSEYLSDFSAQRILIFCRQLHHIGEIYCFLNDTCPSGTIEMFHSRTCEQRQKDIVQRICQLTDSLRVVVCSSSFSMGMDIPGLNLVIHYGVPSSIDQYVQETGRIGRDGTQSHAIIFAHKSTLVGNIDVQVKEYVKTKNCRRRYLLGVFQEKPKTDLAPYICCDNCASIYEQCDCTDSVCFHRQSVSDSTSIPEKYVCNIKTVPKNVLRTEIGTEQIKLFRTELDKHVASHHKILPLNLTTEIYPSLIDVIVEQHKFIDGYDDVLGYGAYSLHDAETIIDILDHYAPKLCQFVPMQ